MTDPRPQIDAGAEPAVLGTQCTVCGHPLAFAHKRCVACGGPVESARYGPAGTVWAATVVRIPVGDRVPPYSLAYVDLDNGPRILAHVVADGPEAVAPSVGDPVRLCGVTATGDPMVERAS